MNPDELFISRLFLIMPELRLDDVLLESMIKQGVLSESDYKDYAKALAGLRKTKRISSALRNKTLMERILILAPELLSVQTINILRRFDLVDVQQGHLLRLLLKAGNALQAGTVSDLTIFQRLTSITSPVASEELVALIRTIDNAQIEAVRQGILARSGNTRLNKWESPQIKKLIEDSLMRADLMRGAFLAAKSLHSTYVDSTKARVGWDAATIALKGVFGEDMLKAAIRTGVISAGQFEAIRAAEKAGINLWSKGVKATDYDGWWARSLMVSEGIISPETIGALKSVGIIDDVMARRMNYAARAIRGVTRGQMSKYQASRKFRVTPGETPLQTYARVAQGTDRYLLGLLSESAKRSSAEAARLISKSGYGNLTRAAQYDLVAREMQKEMRALGENMSSLIIFGEKETARAAVEAQDWLQQGVLNKLDPRDARSLRLTSRAGLDSFVSRGENKVKLARSVYGNMNLWTGKVSKEISIGLLRGQSAREIAKSVERLIDPNVRGGVSYAAMRLARTEINNSFHNTAIRYTREMPWVEAYHWNLSSLHGLADVCNTMSQDDHDNIGAGNYKKRNVPQKPHPHCFCFITTVITPPGEFEKSLKRGSYDKYLKSTSKFGAFSDDYDQAARSNGAQVWDGLWKDAIPDARKAVTKILGALLVQAINNPLAFEQNLRSASAFVQRMPGRAQVAGRMLTSTKSKILNGGRRAIDGTPAAVALPGGLMPNSGRLITNTGSFADMAVDDLDEFDHSDKIWGALEDINRAASPQSQLANSMYSGTAAYSGINEFLRDGGSLDEMGDIISEFFGGDDVVRTLAKNRDIDGMARLTEDSYALLADGPMAASRKKQYQLLEASVEAGDRMMADHADDWLKSGQTFSQYLADGFRDLPQQATLKTDTIMYRVTSSPWMGGKLTAESGVGRVFEDKAFVSTQFTKDYYKTSSAVDSEGFYLGGAYDTTLRIFASQGTRFGSGEGIQMEGILPPNSKFEVLGFEDYTGEDGLIRTYVDVLLR